MARLVRAVCSDRPGRLLVWADATPIAYSDSMRWRAKPAYDCTVALTI
jgi:hypothetical protein